MEQKSSQPLTRGAKLFELIARPELSLTDFIGISTEGTLDQFHNIIDAISTDREEVLEAAEVLIKYDGYIARERALADKMQRLENIKIRDRFDYASLHQLSTEARQKLEQINPETLAQASRIPGISPSDISVLLVLLGR